MRTNDMLLGGMTFILMGTVGSTAYYAVQDSNSSKAKAAAEKNLDEVTRQLDDKEASYATLSNTNSRLNAELRETKDQLDETSLSLQKRDEMIANGGLVIKGGEQTDGDPTNEGEAVALKIAQRNISDLKKRNEELQKFADDIIGELDANSREEALTVFRTLVAKEVFTPEPNDEPNDPAEDEVAIAGPKNAAKQSQKKTIEPFVRAKGPQENNSSGNKNADSIVDSGLNLASPKNAEKPTPQIDPIAATEPTRAIEDTGEIEIDPELVAVTPRNRTSVERPSLGGGQAKDADAMLLQEIDALKAKLNRSERILQEQAELIERIKPSKNGVNRSTSSIAPEEEVVRVSVQETGMRTFRESNANSGFSSKRGDSKTLVEYKEDGTIIETTILP